MADSLVEELNYQIAKMDDELSRLRLYSLADTSIIRDLQSRRDEHYERLIRLDGLGASSMP